MKFDSLWRNAVIFVKTTFHKCIALLKLPEVWLYLLFGVLTTAVDWVVSFALYKTFDRELDVTPLLIHLFDTAAWLAAVIFAFFTNRIFVFKSSRKGFVSVIMEFLSFAAGRVVTLLLQEGIIFVFFNLIHLDKYIVKIGAAVIVVILNYFISRFIFKGKNKNVTQ